MARMTFDAVLLSDGALVANEAKVSRWGLLECKVGSVVMAADDARVWCP